MHYTQAGCYICMNHDILNYSENNFVICAKKTLV